MSGAIKNAAYAHIPGSLRALIHQMVYAQDSGYPLADELIKAGFELSFIDRIAVACDNERLKMRNSGIPVYVRTDAEKAFILGLEEKPFKQPHQCIQHSAAYTTITEGETGAVRDAAYCRFCGVEMELMPEPSLASLEETPSESKEESSPEPK